MVECRLCGKTYSDETVECFAKAGIPLEGLCCEICHTQTLVRVKTSLQREVFEYGV